MGAAGVLPLAAGGEAAAGVPAARGPPAAPPLACACSRCTFSGIPCQQLAIFKVGYSTIMGLTFKRYSTARSGLKNAALIARSISALGKPMLSISAIASSRCGPRVRADGSLKLWPSADAAAVGADAGDGVDGAFDVVFDVAGPGAAGAAGVCAVAGAGVEGSFELDEEAAGVALG